MTVKLNCDVTTNFSPYVPIVEFCTTAFYVVPGPISNSTRQVILKRWFSVSSN